MESFTNIMALDIQPHELKELQPDVKQIYERRMKIHLTTVE